MWETRVRSLGREDLLEKEMATHSSTLAWKIPWMEEPGRLQAMGSQRVRHDWATSMSCHSWSARNCHLSSNGLQVVTFWNFCLHVNLPILPPPHSPQSESYTCPEVPKDVAGSSQWLVSLPWATTDYHYHQEAETLVAACQSSSFATRKENTPNIFQVNHCGSLQW